MQKQKRTNPQNFLPFSSFFNSLVQQLVEHTRSTSNNKISPLSGSIKSLLALSLIENIEQQVFLFSEKKLVDEFYVELSTLGLEEYLISIPEIISDQLQEKLTRFLNAQNFILISTYELLKLKLPDPGRIEKNLICIRNNNDHTFNEIIDYLTLLEYQKVKFVEEPGQFSQRGSIIDFWSYSEKNPARLEFDGDFLESIRLFDCDSQRSTEIIAAVTIARGIGRGDDSLVENYTADIFDYLVNPVIFCSEYELQNLPSNEVVVTSNSTQQKGLDIINPINDNDEFPDVVQEIPKEILKIKTVDLDSLFSKPNVCWFIEQELQGDKRLELSVNDAPSIGGNYKLLVSTIFDFSSKDYKIFITTENDLQTSRLKDLLVELHPELNSLIESSSLNIITLPISKGFILHNKKLLVLTDYQIFSKPYRTKTQSSKKYKKSKSQNFASIKHGDFVVHEDFGIGKYAGLETITIGEIKQESMKIIYAGGGVVYVNLNYLSLVKKFSTAENASPSLSTLGTADWTNIKNKARKKIKEAARELIELYAKRKSTKGYSFGQDTIWQKELEASFLYEDTPDQVKVSLEVKEDMQAENPMDRLVCGDVGFGKTEIAVRAAFKAVQDGKQVVILVPTTILAEQHYNTFNDRLSQFPIRVAVLSRFQSKKEQSEITKLLPEGKIDVVIGTHRLLSKDISFKDLGLLIIDEEHRFGVKAKEKLRSIKVNVDTLTLTATPIPRTLNLSLLGARDLSIIATPPPNRQPISTYVSTFDIFKIKEWIYAELKRNGQVYFVHDRVQSIDKLADYLIKYMPNLKIAVAHGQMKPSQLEDVIHGFLNRKFDILLSTKIIESGIDIPNVNTIIVNRADRFGLAELHQLRGRVGRSDRQAFAYFIVPSLNSINKKALRRLQAIEEFTDVGAGFNLSMRDLEIRGAGNLLGTEQSGFINEIGFDLFIKLINQAVEELKYQEFKELFKTLPKPKEKTEPTIDTYFEIGIPEEYMPSQSDRLNFYTALFSISSIEELNDLLDEMKDRFGALPILLLRLINAAKIKFLASQALFERIIIQRKNIFLILPKGNNEDYYQYRFVQLMRLVMTDYKNKITFNQQKENIRLIILNNFESPEKIYDFLIEFCNKAIESFKEEKIQPDLN